MTKPEDRLSNLGKTDNRLLNAIVDVALFLGIGGIQISGWVALAGNKKISAEMLKDLPRVSYEQGKHNVSFFSE